MNKKYALVELTKIQFKAFFREPGIVFWALVFPILISWVLGIAFNTKRETQFTVFVIEKIKKSESGRPATQMTDISSTIGKDIFSNTKVKLIKGNESEALQALKRGKISLFIENKGDSLLFFYDPNNAEAKMNHLLLEREMNKKTPQLVKAAVIPITSAGNRYIDFLIPGLIAFGIMNSCLWGISYNLIDYRMKKLLRRMVSTPMKKSHFLFSVIISRIALCTIETIFLIGFAYLYFGTTISGSVAGFVLVFLSGIGVFAGLAIIISSRAKNSQVGNGIINAITLPMTILSGVFFNYHNFPDWAIKIIQALPLTLLVDNLRGILIESFTFKSVLLPSGLMMGLGLVLFFIGIKIYKWY